MQHEDDPTDADSRSAAPPTNKRSRAKGWILGGAVIAAVAIGWAAYSRLETDAVAKTGPAALPPAPQVIASKPLVRELDSRLGFLGQFSAVEQVELRAQVGGTLTGIRFKDGDIVNQGDLLFTIDARPYEIKLAQANAELEAASALADFHAAGATDYVCLAFKFGEADDPSHGTGVLYSFTTDRPGGFHQAEIQLMRSTLPGFPGALWRRRARNGRQPSFGALVC